MCRACFLLAFAAPGAPRSIRLTARSPLELDSRSFKYYLPCNLGGSEQQCIASVNAAEYTARLLLNGSFRDKPSEPHLFGSTLLLLTTTPYSRMPLTGVSETRHWSLIFWEACSQHHRMPMLLSAPGSRHSAHLRDTGADVAAALRGLYEVEDALASADEFCEAAVARVFAEKERSAGILHEIHQQNSRVKITPQSSPIQSPKQTMNISRPPPCMHAAVPPAAVSRCFFSDCAARCGCGGEARG